MLLEEKKTRFASTANVHTTRCARESNEPANERRGVAYLSIAHRTQQ